ncbi:MAG TPA: GNAT family N-acetyltransferase [Polyangia bacterium]|nr:GNAT family N-acetyltransferase [Polyangia bacterium]
MTGAPTFERCRYDDPVVDALVEELQEEYVVRYGSRDGTPVDPDQFAEPGGSFLVAYLDGVPVGCVGLRRHDAERVEVKRMFVRGPHRGRGVARALVRASEDEARRLGYRVVLMESGTAQPEAMALYESSGYLPTPGFGYYKDSPLNRCYAKSLTDEGRAPG